MQKTDTQGVRNLVGVSWEDQNGHDTEPVYDPATGQTIAETLSPPASAIEDLRVAVACEVPRKEGRPVRVADIS